MLSVAQGSPRVKPSPIYPAFEAPELLVYFCAAYPGAQPAAAGELNAWAEQIGVSLVFIPHLGDLLQALNDAFLAGHFAEANRILGAWRAAREEAPRG